MEQMSSGPGNVLNILKISPINIKYMASSQVSLVFREILHLKTRCLPDGGGVPSEVTKLVSSGVHNWV
jgi:hypothetical protein